jgi:hypothetical protein
LILVHPAPKAGQFENLPFVHLYTFPGETEKK